MTSSSFTETVRSLRVISVPATQEATLPERAICAYFTCLPFLWVLGLSLPASFLIVFGSFILCVRSIRALSYALPWFAVGASQFLSVIVNWAASRQPPLILLKHAVASYVSGWFLLGAAIGLGASGVIRAPQLLKSIVRVSYYTIALAIPAYALALILKLDSLFLLSPFGYLVPSTFASRNFAFGIFVYNWEELGGRLFPRLSLMFPWPTAMGAGGVAMVFIAMNVEERTGRRWAILGGIVMVIASMGRLAVVTLLVGILFRSLLNWDLKGKIVSICLALSLIAAGLLTVPDPGVVANDISDRFNGARAGASEVRNEVYEENWLGFYNSPWLGHGWPGEALVQGENVYDTYAGMVVGSHSTVSGLLYKGGLITFILFLAAFFRTIAGIMGKRDISTARNTFTTMLAVGFTCFGEGLESLVLPMLFVFLWIGTSLQEA